jgi:hypothetical protein
MAVVPGMFPKFLMGMSLLNPEAVWLRPGILLSL